MQRRLFLTNVTGLAVGAAGLALTGCTTTPSTPANPAARRREIDTAADATLSRLYTGVRGARELNDRARGILVFPDVLAAGFVVVPVYHTNSPEECRYVVDHSGARPTSDSDAHGAEASNAGAVEDSNTCSMIRGPST